MASCAPSDQGHPWSRPTGKGWYKKRCSNSENIRNIFQSVFQCNSGSKSEMVETVGMNEHETVQSVKVKNHFWGKLAKRVKREKGRGSFLLCFFNGGWLLSELNCQREGLGREGEMEDPNWGEVTERDCRGRRRRTQIRVCGRDWPSAAGGHLPREEGRSEARMRIKMRCRVKMQTWKSLT